MPQNWRLLHSPIDRTSSISRQPSPLEDNDFKNIPVIYLLIQFKFSFSKVYLEAVGYISTVAAFTIFALMLQVMSTMKKPICSFGMSVNMQAIPQDPVPTITKTIRKDLNVCSSQMVPENYLLTQNRKFSNFIDQKTSHNKTTGK